MNNEIDYAIIRMKGMNIVGDDIRDRYMKHLKTYIGEFMREEGGYSRDDFIETKLVDTFSCQLSVKVGVRISRRKIFGGIEVVACVEEEYTTPKCSGEERILQKVFSFARENKSLLIATKNKG